MNEEEINIVITEAIESFYGHPLLINGLITSVIVIAAFIILRFVIVHFIKGKTEILNKDQRRWINRINNGISISIVATLALIWAPQLQTFALSLTAVAVAVVLTTKELLMCLTGSFLRASSKIFDIGDWISVDGVMGEVMKITATTTLIEKIDTENGSYEFTGATIQIPNSRFLTANVENANFIKSYIYQDITIAIQYNDVDVKPLMEKLKEIAFQHFDLHKDEAVKFNKRIEKKAAVDFADPDPQFSLETTDLGHYHFGVRMFVPTKIAASIGSKVTEEFLSFAHAKRLKASKNKDKG